MQIGTQSTTNNADPTIHTTPKNEVKKGSASTPKQPTPPLKQTSITEQVTAVEPLTYLCETISVQPVAPELEYEQRLLDEQLAREREEFLRREQQSTENALHAAHIQKEIEATMSMRMTLSEEENECLVRNKEQQTALAHVDALDAHANYLAYPPVPDQQNTILREAKLSLQKEALDELHRYNHALAENDQLFEHKLSQIDQSRRGMTLGQVLQQRKRVLDEFEQQRKMLEEQHAKIQSELDQKQLVLDHSVNVKKNERTTASQNYQYQLSHPSNSFIQPQSSPITVVNPSTRYEQI